MGGGRGVMVTELKHPRAGLRVESDEAGFVQSKGRDGFQQGVSLCCFVQAVKDGVFECHLGGGIARAGCIWVFFEPEMVCGQGAFP